MNHFHFHKKKVNTNTRLTDNSRILKTSLNLFGALKGDFFSAAKLWPEMPPAFKFKLQFENLAFLDFANRLTTNLMNVADNMLEVKFNETPSTIDAAKEAGMGDLSFRTVCVPVSADYIKVTAIGFPMAAADLQERYPLQATHSSWDSLYSTRMF